MLRFTKNLFEIINRFNSVLFLESRLFSIELINCGRHVSRHCLICLIFTSQNLYFLSLFFNFILNWLLVQLLRLLVILSILFLKSTLIVLLAILLSLLCDLIFYIELISFSFGFSLLCTFLNFSVFSFFIIIYTSFFFYKLFYNVLTHYFNLLYW
jgi:hypothetical protein